MNRGTIIAGVLAALLAGPALSQPAAADPNQPPPHTLPYPDLGSGKDRAERRTSYDLSPELHRESSPPRSARSSAASMRRSRRFRPSGRGA